MMGGITNLGFIGLGAMGLPMARLLAESKQFDSVKVFDVQAGRAESLAGHGAAAFSAREAADGSDALFLMVANEAQAREALFGPDAAADALPGGSVVIVMSTIGPEAVRGIAAELSERVVPGRGVRLLDAPVSGGVARAGSGELLIMAGGERSVFDELGPALNVLGSSVVHCGERAGDGQSVKLVNQLLCGVHIVAAAEALAYAESLGLDPEFVLDTIGGGAANSFMLEDRGRRMLSRSFDDPKSTLEIFVKDMDLVCDAAESSGFETVLAAAARKTYLEGQEAGLGREDDSGVIRLFQKHLSVEVSDTE